MNGIGKGTRRRQGDTPREGKRRMADGMRAGELEGSGRGERGVEEERGERVDVVAKETEGTDGERVAATGSDAEAGREGDKLKEGDSA